MTVVPDAAAEDVVADDYVGIQRFYARHMHALDAGDVDAWADTLTEDVVFSHNGGEPRRGRDVVAARMGEISDDLAERGVTRRHWVGMLDTRRRDGRTVDVRCYALVFETPRGGLLTLRTSTVCDDVLLRTDTGWLLDARRMSHDGAR
ncbi:MAG: nuclear transport factor 2 family protein [Saccharothrix sp.]|nr:nuclear transport factor 2 family protein [Saccharothrix sp.]